MTERRIAWSDTEEGSTEPHRGEWHVVTQRRTARSDTEEGGTE